MIPTSTPGALARLDDFTADPAGGNPAGVWIGDVLSPELGLRDPRPWPRVAGLTADRRSRLSDREPPNRATRPAGRIWCSDGMNGRPDGRRRPTTD